MYIYIYIYIYIYPAKLEAWLSGAGRRWNGDVNWKDRRNKFCNSVFQTRYYKTLPFNSHALRIYS